MILAIDPGNTQSGFVLFDGGKVIVSGIRTNFDTLILITSSLIAYPQLKIAIEMIASYGMPVGAEVFETCVWIGRFVEHAAHGGINARLVFRRDVKLHLCSSPRAKDGNVRQALIDKLGAPGTKKNQGPTYGVKSHAWAALAVATYALDNP